MYVSCPQEQESSVALLLEARGQRTHGGIGFLEKARATTKHSTHSENTRISVLIVGDIFKRRIYDSRYSYIPGYELALTMRRAESNSEHRCTLRTV